MLLEKHYITRIGWLRAAVLGANDGILSTTSLTIGVAAASPTRYAIILASLAGLVAGALSMAAGEYVSVSSQSDTEKADLNRERQELTDDPDGELQELADSYEKRGVHPQTALLVAAQLMERNALEAHAKDELGINEITQAKPLQAALASAASFIAGAILPVIVAIFAPMRSLLLWEYGASIVFLAILGNLSARMGGASKNKAMIRVVLGGTLAMAISALVGYIFGSNHPV
ncbi:MAG: VIT family protein [Taibaiella sp.]|jgi:VIT1/CCC1 family predicted Fe2+/Mn2+ transporter